MGLFFTLLFIFTAYLGPQTLFGSLADYHIEVIIAVIAFICSIPSLQGAHLSNLRQTYAIAGMCFAVFASILFIGWISGAPGAVILFIPNAFSFFLVYLNCKKKWHLQLLIAILFLACAYTILRGYLAVQSGDELSNYVLPQHVIDHYIYRIRGVSFLNDPNDFAQLLVSLIPLLFFFWRKNFLTNILFVIVPAIILLYGMFLTHSRGAIVATLVICILAGRRKIGTIPSLILAGVMFAGFTAVGWSGGREIDVEAGEDRLEAWSAGLQMIKSHPIFGVGFDQYTEHYYITAHNSIVVCAAELGFVGLFFWILFILATLFDMSALGRIEPPAPDPDSLIPEHLRMRAAPVKSERSELPAPRNIVLSRGAPVGVLADESAEDESNPLSKIEVRRMAQASLYSLAGYLTAAWFLSRSYVMTLFIYGAVAEVIYSLAEKQGIVVTRTPLRRLLWITAGVSIILIMLVYAMLRADHFMPH